MPPTFVPSIPALVVKYNMGIQMDSVAVLAVALTVAVLVVGVVSLTIFNMREK